MRSVVRRLPPTGIFLQSFSATPLRRFAPQVMPNDKLAPVSTRAYDSGIARAAANAFSGRGRRFGGLHIGGHRRIVIAPRRTDVHLDAAGSRHTGEV
ncbi:hypothetical protein AB0J84_07680 [Micromonospora arborensis]|uniref:hypothetical protein n=1 Tax=Micromonospora arborensis TaxID=2116518 RepID=UPI0034303389